jgi:hypothetical protein
VIDPEARLHEEARRLERGHNHLSSLNTPKLDHDKFASMLFDILSGIFVLGATEHRQIPLILLTSLRCVNVDGNPVFVITLDDDPLTLLLRIVTVTAVWTQLSVIIQLDGDETFQVPLALGKDDKLSRDWTLEQSLAA